jgi:hypothetical protein
MILRRIAPLSLAKVFGLVYALLGLLIGALISFFAVIGAFAAAAQSEGNEAFAFLFGVGAIVIMPVFYGVFGAISGLLIAIFYNLVARVAGGLELELEPKATA